MDSSRTDERYGSDDQWFLARLRVVGPDNECRPNVSRGYGRLLERLDALRRRRRRWGWAAAALAASCLPLAALPVTRGMLERGVSTCVRESSRMGELLLGKGLFHSRSSTYVEIADRKLAPDFEMSDESGQRVRLSDFRGKAVVLNFWATWCLPCRVEIPMLQSLQEGYRGKSFTVLGVSMEQEGWSVIKPYMEKVKFNYPIMLGGNDIAALYGGVESIPTTLLIDKSGRIAALHVGLCSRSEYETDINAVLKEQ